MKIGIIGSGEVGQKLGTAFLSEGHEVMLGTRNPGKEEVKKWKAENPKGQCGTFGVTAQFGDVLVLDGHGIAHPRRVGIATHFGLVMQTPTIGCAKSVLTGKYAEPPNEPGTYTDLIHHNEVIAKVLRTKRNVKPVVVSPGNLISMQQSLDIILQCVRKYRIPEPTRFAHNFVNEERRKYLGEGGEAND